MLVMTMKRMQMNLKFLNFYFGAIDGIKAGQTIQAIKEFQNFSGIGVDGIAGQQTIDAMRNLICKIQRILGCEQDGVAGNNTIELCKQYQANHGLQVDRNLWNKDT